MARQTGQGKAAKRENGTAVARVSKAKRALKNAVPGKTLRRSRGSQPRSSAPPVVPERPSDAALLVDTIAHEIFQTRAAYRADLFAHEHDDSLLK